MTTMESKAIYRLSFQSLIVLVMIFMTNESLVNVGNLFGFGDINLGYFQYQLQYFVLSAL